jgi:hypothetical protein
VKSTSDKPLDDAASRTASGVLQSKVQSVVATKAAAVGVTGLAGHFSSMSGEVKTAANGELGSSGLSVDSFSITGVALPDDVQKTIDDAAANAVVGERMSFTGGGESHTIWIDVNGQNADVMMASTPNRLASTLGGLAKKAEELTDRAKGEKAKGLIQRAQGLVSATDAAADKAVKDKAASSADVVSKESQLVSLLVEILNTLYTRSQTVEDAVARGEDDDAKLENAERLAAYALASGKDPKTMTPDEKKALLQGHAMLLDDRQEGKALRKVIPQRDADRNVADQRPYGANPSIGGSVGVKSNTTGMTAPQVQDTLGLDYTQTDKKTGRSANPYFSPQPDGTWRGKDTVNVVETPITREMADEAKIPLDKDVRSFAEAQTKDPNASAKDKADAQKVLDNSRERNRERTKVNEGTPDEYERSNPWNPYAGTGATMPSARRRPDGDVSVNQELQMMDRKDLPVGAKQLTVDKDGKEKVTAVVKERTNPTTGAKEKYWEAV